MHWKHSFPALDGALLQRSYLTFNLLIFMAASNHESATCSCLACNVYLHQSDPFLPRLLAIVSETFWQPKIHPAEDTATYIHPESSLPVFFLECFSLQMFCFWCPLQPVCKQAQVKNDNYGNQDVLKESKPQSVCIWRQSVPEVP